MDANLKHFLESKKNLILDTKIPAVKKQSTTTPKPGPGMMNKPLESDPYKRLALNVIKDLPSKKDLIEKFQSFIDSEEAHL
jgi:hypothetical protein